MKISELSLTKKISLGCAAVTGVAATVGQLAIVATKRRKVQKAFLKVCGGTAAIIGGTGVAWVVINKYCGSKATKRTRMAEADAYTIERQADAMLYKAKAEADIARHKVMGKVPQEQPANNNAGEFGEETEEDTATWINKFNLIFTMPELPPFLKTIISWVPKGYEPAMLAHILSMFAAMCFSKVRARYLDNELHAPNLQVIVEGNWGTGKGKFESIFKTLFGQVIKRDKGKIQDMGRIDYDENGKPLPPPSYIIQVSGIGTSMSRYIDILAGNSGCHTYMFNSEVRALAYDLKKSNGINFDFLRKAFENGDITRNNRSKDGENGIFPIYLNYTITGTPAEITDSFKKELEGGTLSRIFWSCIPEAGRVPGTLVVPDENILDSIHKQIEKWREIFCFRETYDGDFSVDEYIIDLPYVCSALEEWSLRQYDQGEIEKNHARQDVRMRIAAIAFHFAICLHMICGEPEDTTSRQMVVNITLYLANYGMERFLHKFGAQHNAERKRNSKLETANDITFKTEEDHSTPAETSKVLSKEEEEACTMKKLYDEGKSQGEIAIALYGSNEDKHKMRVKRTLDKFYPNQITWGEARKQHNAHYFG